MGVREVLNEGSQNITVILEPKPKSIDRTLKISLEMCYRPAPATVRRGNSAETMINEPALFLLVVRGKQRKTANF